MHRVVWFFCNAASKKVGAIQTTRGGGGAANIHTSTTPRDGEREGVCKYICVEKEIPPHTRKCQKDTSTCQKRRDKQAKKRSLSMLHVLRTWRVALRFSENLKNKAIFPTYSEELRGFSWDSSGFEIFRMSKYSQEGFWDFTSRLYLTILKRGFWTLFVKDPTKPSQPHWELYNMTRSLLTLV